MEVFKDPPLKQGIIFGLSVEFALEDVIEDSGARKATRLLKHVNGIASPTESVVLSFEDQLPNFVCISFKYFKIKTFYPLSLRCSHCNSFGPSAKACTRAVRLGHLVH